MKNFKESRNDVSFIQDEMIIKKFIEFIKSFGLINHYPNSQIIKREDFIKINNMIGGENRFILKYSAKRDNCDTEIFHKNCDGICGCLFICKVEEGDIVGGYLTAKIQKNDGFLDDNKAFLFNLSKNIVKKNKKSYKNAIQNCSNSTFFIRFGESCKVFYLAGNCLNSKDSYAYYCGCQTNFDTQDTNIFNRSKGEYFKVENFEVFQVI